jgi:hypothetical protein
LAIFLQPLDGVAASQRRDKEEKPKKPLVLILGATHTVVYIRVCTQKKEEEEGFSMCVTQSFPSEYSTQKN